MPPDCRDRWAIVGGGLLGMTLAYRLAQARQEVTLFEAADQLGGLAAAWNLGDVVWDRHYHVTLQSDVHLRALLSELGLEQDLQWVRTRTGFYVGGHLYSLSNALEFLRFPPLRLIDKFRLGLTILRASKVRDWRRLERILAVDWLRRWSGRRTLERIWLPLLRAKLGDNYSRTSAAFIWATIARMYAARCRGLKTEVFGYVPGGYARILKRFAEVLAAEGVDIRLGHPVTAIEPAPHGGLTVVLAPGRRSTFARVVVTAAAPIAARLCVGLPEAERRRLADVAYQGIVCASLLLRKPLAGFYVTNITDAWVPFTAVIEMSALVDRREFAGHALVYLPKYVPENDPIFDLPDSCIEHRFVAALERMYPGFCREDVLCFRVSRVRYVMPIPTLRYSETLPPLASSVPGLYLVNSAHIVNGTLNVNETVQLANRAVTALLGTPPFGAARAAALAMTTHR